MKIINSINKIFYVAVILILLIIAQGYYVFAENVNLKRQNISPFLKNEHRYKDIYKMLIKRGISDTRIREIFSSPRAKKIDMAPINIMSSVNKIPKLNAKEASANNKYLSKIPMVIKHLKEYEKYYDQMEDRFQVNREVVTALLLKETYLGMFNGWKHNSFITLNTMVGFFELPKNPSTRQKVRMPRLIKFAKEHLVGLIVFYEQHGLDVTTLHLPSSYAGALGIPQFMPGWLEYAISAKNKTPDIVNNMPDAILSVGNILKHKFGWQYGLIDFKYLNNIDYISEVWYNFSQKNIKAHFCQDFNLDGQPLVRFDKTHANIPNIGYLSKYIKVLMGYNFSTNYALGILQIAKKTNSSL